MNEQILSGQNTSFSKRDRRRRGTHAVTCKCPKPMWFPPAHYKSPPGEIGHALRRLIKKDPATGRYVLRIRLSRHPFFVQYRSAAGRKRDFRPEMCNLLDVIPLLFIQYGELGTGIVTQNCQQMADRLSPKDDEGNIIKETRVEPSRVTRALDIMEAYGLISRPEAIIDPATGYCMPCHIVINDRFWEIIGVNMDRLINQRNTRLAAEAEAFGMIATGDAASVNAARRRWYDNNDMRVLVSRREKAVRAKRHRRLSRLPLDERRNAMAKLLRARPVHDWMRLSLDEFDRLVWQHLRQLDLGPDKPYSVY